MKTIVGITEELTFNQLSKLDSFVILYNKISHQLYVDLFIKKLPIKDLSPAYQAKYSISKRHFDSIRKLLEGKVSSIIALNKFYLSETKDKIKDIEKDLLKQTKTYNSYKEKYKSNNNLTEFKTHKEWYKEFNYQRNKEFTLIGSKYKEKRISSNNRHIKKSNLPDRNNLTSVVYWKELKEIIIKQQQHEKKCRINIAKYSTSLGQNNEPVMNHSVGALL